jgi:hypothetical protein
MLDEHINGHLRCSHLTALCNGDILHWLSFRIRYCSRVFNLGDNIHAFDDIPEDYVLAVQVGCAILRSNDEELGTIGVGA